MCFHFVLQLLGRVATGVFFVCDNVIIFMSTNDRMLAGRTVVGVRKRMSVRMRVAERQRINYCQYRTGDHNDKMRIELL